MRAETVVSLIGQQRLRALSITCDSIITLQCDSIIMTLQCYIVIQRCNAWLVNTVPSRTGISTKSRHMRLHYHGAHNGDHWCMAKHDSADMAMVHVMMHGVHHCMWWSKVKLKPAQQ